jgi:hypothetical protein
MVSGVTGGLLPPPPQASSNPDRRKLDTKARELNRITSSQIFRKAPLSHSSFVERVTGARAALAGDACRGCLSNNAPAEWGKRSIHQFADKQGIRYSRALLLARNMWKLKLDGFTALKPAARPATAGKSRQEISKRDTSPVRPVPAFLVRTQCGRSRERAWLLRRQSTSPRPEAV